jgi:hypothetical protein
LLVAATGLYFAINQGEALSEEMAARTVIDGSHRGVFDWVSEGERDAAVGYAVTPCPAAENEVWAEIDSGTPICHLMRAR